MSVRSVLALLIGLSIFAGLPLVGWGVSDLRGFVDHPARAAYLVLAAILQIIVVVRFPGAGRNEGEGKKIVRRQRAAVVLLQLLSLGVVIGAPFADRRHLLVLGGSEGFRYLGLILFAAGFLVMSWSAAVLGRQFSTQVTIQEGHTLVTAGPYRTLRHPRYLGIIVANIGFALVFRSGVAFLLVTALIGVLGWRIHDEELLLRREFGPAWDDYARRSWRLVPFVY